MKVADPALRDYRLDTIMEVVLLIMLCFIIFSFTPVA